MEQNMTGGTQGDEDPVAQSRRDVLKKAVAAAAAAGVVWQAPQVKGLSLVPDYAAAGTATPTVTVKFGDANGPTYGGDSNYFHFQPSPGTSPASGPTQNAQLAIDVNLGAAGNAQLRVAQGVLADGDPFGGNVVFTVDPPFNKCRITAVNSTPSPGPGNNIGPAPVPNDPGSFTQSFNVGNHPAPTTRVDNVSVTIDCT